MVSEDVNARTTMRCFQCHSVFPANDVVETLPFGKALAFDPSRGRLWVICSGCRRWSLLPIESRWEILEELERRTRDSGRQVAHTDNIGLFQVRDIQVVQIGHYHRQEEAWWRYGRELAARYVRARRITRYGEILDSGIELAGRVGVFVLIGLPLWPERKSEVEDRWLRRVKARYFGHHAWRGEARCACGAALNELNWTDAAHARIGFTERGLSLKLQCHACERGSANSGIILGGVEAEHVIRRTLAYRNFAGASEKQIGYATALIDQAGGSESAMRRIALQQRDLGRLISTDRVALEIVVNEENERAIAQMEARELEARWKEEEEIASIIDGELTPLPFFSNFIARYSSSGKP